MLHVNTYFNAKNMESESTLLLLSYILVIEFMMRIHCLW